MLAHFLAAYVVVYTDVSATGIARQELETLLLPQRSSNTILAVEGTPYIPAAP
jgi:hypothetical protein